MPVPELTNYGVLPNGVHTCSLQEIGNRYATSELQPRRGEIWSKFLQFVDFVRAVDLFSAVYVDGSFTTDKGDTETVLPHKDPPGDIDAVLFLPSPNPQSLVRLSTPPHNKILDNEYIKSVYETHLFISTPRTPPSKDIRLLFQRIKLEEALERGMPRGSTKGILRVKL